MGRPRISVKLENTQQDENRVKGRFNEHRIIEILTSAGLKARGTKASGATFGDQDGTICSGIRTFRVSMKHKSQRPDGKYPSLPLIEVCEPVNFVASNVTNEIPLTIVTWEDRSDRPKRSDFVVLPMSTFIEMLQELEE